jgi:hypothetical protein
MQPTVGKLPGEPLQPDPLEVPPWETWAWREWRLGACSPDQGDGGRDCWVNGVKCGGFRGINWRSDGALKVNGVQLSLYLEWSDYGRYGEEADGRTVWCEDVVAGTR